MSDAYQGRPSAAQSVGRGRLTLLLAGLVACGSGLLVLLRLVPSLQATRKVAQLASFIPFGILGWLLVLALILPLVRRSRPARFLAVAAAFLVLLQCSWLAPRFMASEQPGGGQPVRLISQNLEIGAGATPEFLQRASRADIVILVEVTPQAIARLEAGGIRRSLPYGAGSPAEGAEGTYVYSRWPITDLGIHPHTTFHQAFTTVQIPHVGTVNVVGVHPVNPLGGADAWMNDARQIAATTRGLPHDVPVVMAGDFNATPDHRSLRTILKMGGLRLASNEVGAGYLPTWPVHMNHVPTMLPIDHVLLRGDVRVDDVHSYPLADSDHRGLEATLRLPTR